MGRSGLRPVYHQTAGRAEAHNRVCFPAFVLWKPLRSGGGVFESGATMVGRALQEVRFCLANGIVSQHFLHDGGLE